MCLCVFVFVGVGVLLLFCYSMQHPVWNTGQLTSVHSSSDSARAQNVRDSWRAAGERLLQGEQRWGRLQRTAAEESSRMPLSQQQRLYPRVVRATDYKVVSSSSRPPGWATLLLLSRRWDPPLLLGRSLRRLPSSIRAILRIWWRWGRAHHRKYSRTKWLQASAMCAC